MGHILTYFENKQKYPSNVNVTFETFEAVGNVDLKAIAGRKNVGPGEMQNAFVRQR